ncbi:MAG: OprO/OprP family phosphate-selective porin [Melioribacteraceae bacterium]|nr:OprO/OprP family phosphate-selective porin [Melioribacteraceae bacterium]
MLKYILQLVFVLFFVNNLIAQDDFFGTSSSVGGYGELHYNKVVTENNTSNTLDFHRFVIFYGHQWSEKWSFKAEVELEHNFVADGEGELELEQAYVDYRYSNWFGFQAGVILPSVGLINELHEPPLFFGVERPDYNKSIIPTTWFGNGISFYGNYMDLDYKLTIMEGLDADAISPKNGIRSARQKGFKSNADDLLYNARIDYLGVSGLKVGFSYTYNNATGDSINNPLSLIEAHLKYSKSNLHIVGEFGQINYGESDLESSTGYYFDLGYNIGSFFDFKTQIIPFARYSNYNTASSTKQGGNTELAYDNKQIMVGLNILPISEVVFKFDYSQVENKLSKEKTNLFNLGVGYMF